MPSKSKAHLKILQRADGKRNSKPPVRFSKGDEEEEESKGAKRGAEESPGKEERERRKQAGPEATPMDKARKKDHDEMGEEHEFEGGADHGGDKEQGSGKEEQGGDGGEQQGTDVKEFLIGGKLVRGKDGAVEELCGTCGKVQGECKGHVVQGTEGKEGKETKETKETKEIKETKESEGMAMENKGGMSIAQEPGKGMAEQGAVKGARRKPQCCQCKKGGACVGCACVTEGRRCLDTCKAQSCGNKAGMQRKEAKDKESKEKGMEAASQAWVQHWATASTGELLREVFKLIQTVNGLNDQVAQLKTVLQEKRGESKQLRDVQRETKELRTQVLSIQKSGEETLKEVKAVGEPGARIEAMEAKWKETQGLWKKEVEDVLRKHKDTFRKELEGEMDVAWKEVQKRAEQQRNQDLGVHRGMILEEMKKVEARWGPGERKEEEKAAERMVDATPIKGARPDAAEEEQKGNPEPEPLMRRSFDGKLLRLTEEDRKQLRALGFVFTDEVEGKERPRLQRRGSEPATPGKMGKEVMAPLPQKHRQGEQKGDPLAVGKQEEKKPVRRQRYPAVIIKGFAEQPGAADFTKIMQQLGVPDIKARMMQAKQQGRSFMLRVLLCDDDQVEQVLRNKKVMRGSGLWIDRDRYARDWERVLKEESEAKVGKVEKAGRRQNGWKVAQEEEKRLNQLRKAPRTEHFQGIHNGIQGEAREQRRKSGNGQRGPWGRNRREQRDSPRKVPNRWITV